MSSTNSMRVLLIAACVLFSISFIRAVADIKTDVCREEGPTCRLRHFRDHMRIVNETLTTERDSKGYSLKFDVVPGATYSATFEQFILKNRLFKAKFDTTSLRPMADLMEVLKTSERACAEFCSPAEAFLDSQLSKVGGKLMVPRIAANNYLRRTTPGDDPDGMRRSPYFKEWPAVRHVQAERPSRAMQCPANMHMVAWHYAAPGTSMTVRAFPLGSSAAIFKSRLFHQEQNVTGGLPFTGHFTVFQRTGFPDNVDAGASDEEAQALPQHGETDLASSQDADSPGEYVFIPNTHVVSFKCETESCPVVAVCFVDASNLNQFRDSLFFSASVGVSEGELHSALMQPAFDTELPKNPQDVSLETYMGVPVVSDATASGSTAGGADAGTPSVASSNRRDRRKKQTTGGGGGGSADFKDWQELTRWKMLVTSLTIQKPAAPGIVAVSRQHATLAWKSPFVPPPSDKTAFGFKVVFCPVVQAHLEEEVYLPIDLGNAGQTHAGCKSQSFYRGAEGGGLQEEVDEAHLRRTGDTALLFRAVVAGMLPNSQYQLRLGVVYDQRESPLSSFTPPIRTATVTAPTPPLGLEGPLSSAELKIAFHTATKAYKTGNRLSGELHFGWPEDDGGLPILGFHVYKRAVTPVANSRDLWEVADQPWHWVGAFPARRDDRELTNKIELLNLQPSGAIQFSIAAYNYLGSSGKSVPSDATVVALTGPHVVHGWGHEHYLGELSHEYLSQHAHVHRGGESATPHGVAARAMVDHGLTAHCESELVFVDGDRQQLHSSSNHCFHSGVEDNVDAPKFEVWRAHWSPSQVSIWAKPAIVTPTLSAVLFGGTLVGKIAFVLRGEIPFTEKAISAQRAGACAVVVVDDGKCTKYDQQCLPGASKYNHEGFGAHDIKAHWERVHIPVFFLLKSEAERFSIYLPLTDLLFPSAVKTDEL